VAHWSEEKNKTFFGPCNNANYHGHNYDLIVTVTKSTDATKSFVFHLEQMQTGEDSCYYFLYAQDNINYALEVANSFSTNVTTSTEHNIVGTFTGRLYTEDQ
jgi:6-pyruvoyl-tetrahydropterin synthase